MVLPSLLGPARQRNAFGRSSFPGAAGTGGSAREVVSFRAPLRSAGYWRDQMRRPDRVGAVSASTTPFSAPSVSTLNGGRPFERR